MHTIFKKICITAFIVFFLICMISDMTRDVLNDFELYGPRGF